MVDDFGFFVVLEYLFQVVNKTFNEIYLYLGNNNIINLNYLNNEYIIPTRIIYKLKRLYYIWEELNHNLFKTNKLLYSINMSIIIKISN